MSERKREVGYISGDPIEYVGEPRIIEGLFPIDPQKTYSGTEQEKHPCEIIEEYLEKISLEALTLESCEELAIFLDKLALARTIIPVLREQLEEMKSQKEREEDE